MTEKKQAKLKAFVAEGLSDGEIAERLGVSRSAVSSTILRLGIVRPPRVKLRARKH